MMIRQTCVYYVVMASGIFLMAGCSYLAGEPKEGVQAGQADNSLERQPKNLAGSYGDIGSNGSIKPNPESSYKMRRETQGRTNNVIILGGPLPIPDLSTGNTTTQGSPGGTTPRSGSVSDSAGPFSGTRGAGK
jgi:hypothetical protein